MLLGVAFASTMALTIQLLTVSATLRLTATATLVLGPHFLSSSTGHWFNKPEKMNKYDVSTNVLNKYFSASKTLKEKIDAPSGAPLLRLQVCKYNKGETHINFCKGVISMSFSTMLELLQEKNNRRVVFYIVTGKDAIFLNKVLKLKCTCFSENVCKVGIPETSLPKYLER